MATDDVACEDEEETDEDGDGVPDGVPVSVPISQRVYEEAEYTAWVSGYEARLDSLELRRECLMVEREVRVMPKRRKWGCVVGAGPGCDLTKGTVGLSVGVTVGYTLF